jgi:acetolactate synthase-1/2/3 large subunit
MMRPLTKYTRQLVHADNIPSQLREAIRLAQEERPGAVHLELPEDVAAHEVDVSPIPPSATAPAAPSAVMIGRAVEMIQTAHHPLLLLGAGSNREGVRSMVQELVEATGIPFFTTQMGKGVIDEGHPLCIGTAALSEGDYVHCAIDYADLIINVGHDVVEKPPFIMRADWPKVIHISRLSANVESVYFPQLEIVGCIATTAQRLRETLRPSPHWDFDYFNRAAEGATSHIHSKDDDRRFPIIPQRLVADVRRALPRDGVVALDNGMYKIWFARNFLAHEPNSVLLDNALATMGAGLPSAMAARMVYPQRKVVALCGDGGFMMNSQEMETAIRLGMDLTVVVLRDDGYGMIKWKQQASAMPAWGLDFGNPDFVTYARSYGAQGYRVEATEDLLPTLQRCLDRPGLHLVEVPVDYSENEEVLSEELRSKTCTL